ncbi:hypothetical protein ER45_029885 (plasmid) [Bacillus mycoides]|nr:hypothetical protein ER45_029885 [Bacillus mycoides]
MKYVNKCIITICTIIGFSYLSLFHMPMSAKAASTHETTIDDIDFEKKIKIRLQNMQQKKK